MQLQIMLLLEAGWQTVHAVNGTPILMINWAFSAAWHERASHKFAIERIVLSFTRPYVSLCDIYTLSLLRLILERGFLLLGLLFPLAKYHGEIHLARTRNCGYVSGRVSSKSDLRDVRRFKEVCY